MTREEGIKRQAEREHSQVPVRLLLKTGRPVTPPTEWWRATPPAQAHDDPAPAKRARGASTLQPATAKTSSLNSPAKQRRSYAEGPDLRNKERETGSECKQPGDPFLFPVDLPDSNAQSPAKRSTPLSTRPGGPLAMGVRNGSLLQGGLRFASTCTLRLSAGRGAIFDDPLWHLPTAPTLPSHPSTLSQPPAPSTTSPTARSNAASRAGGVDSLQSGAGEEAREAGPPVKVLRSGRLSQIPTPWWIGSPVTAIPAACHALPPRSPLSRPGKGTSPQGRGVTPAANPLMRTRLSHPSPKQTGQGSPHLPLSLSPDFESPGTTPCRATPPEKRRRLVRQPIANIVRRIESESPPSQFPPPKEVATGEGAPLQEADHPSQEGEAGVQEPTSPELTPAPEALPNEAPRMPVSATHAGFPPSQALAPDAVGEPTARRRQDSASPGVAGEEALAEGQLRLQSRSSWQSGVSAPTSSAGMHPPSPPAGQGMRRAAGCGGSRDRTPNEDSVGPDAPHSPLVSARVGEQVAFHRVNPSDSQHVVVPGPEGLPVVDDKEGHDPCDHGEGEAGLEASLDAGPGGVVCSDQLTWTPWGILPEEIVALIRGGSAPEEQQSRGKVGAAGASAGGCSLMPSFNEDEHAASQLAQPEDANSQPGKTVAHVLGGEDVPSTTPAQAGTTSGLTTPARKCSPPSTCKTPRQGNRSESPRVTPGPADNPRARIGMEVPVTAAAAPEEMANGPHNNAGSAKKLTTVQRRGKREVRALFDGAQHDIPLRTGPVAKRTRGGCHRMADVPLQSPDNTACLAPCPTLVCASRGGVSNGFPIPAAMRPGNASALAAKHMADTFLTRPRRGAPPMFVPSSAYGNQGSQRPGPESAAQRLRSLQHCLTGVKTDVGGEDDPSTSSVSIGGVQVQDVHACATSEGPGRIGEGAFDLQACTTSDGPRQIEEGTLELSEGLQALAAQLTPSTLQLLQESLAEVEATSNLQEQPRVVCPLAGS